LVGKELPNFIDKTGNQKDFVSIENDYLILYYKNYSDQYKFPGDNGDRSSLILLNSSNHKREIIFDGHLGNLIEYAFFDPKEDIILFTWRNCRELKDTTFIYQYDLNTKKVVAKNILLVEEDYKNPHIFLGGTVFISEVFFANENLYYKVRYQNDSSYNYYDDYFEYNGKIKGTNKINEKEYKKSLLSSGQNNLFQFKTDSLKLKLFIIEPHSDYLPNNYKHKYNGIYINDNKNNIRISNLNGYDFMESNPIWIENGRKIFWGSYLFDTSGNKKELEIVDGNILAVMLK
jgi:hypothetical protein